MKKLLVTLLSLTLLVSGCGKTGTENVVKDFTSKVNDSKSYTLKGNMEIYADEETFTYSLEINFLKDYFYKVKMVNQTNNHEQIILRNTDAVYVITPSLNKSFKFQSEWPENSSQAYILSSITTDMNNDAETKVEEVDGNFVIKSKVNYPNNPELSYQKITVDKDNKIKKTEIYDEKDALKMKVTFTSVEYNTNLKEDDFKLEQYIKEDTNTKDTENNQTNNQNKNEECTDEETCKEQQECTGDDCETDNAPCEGDACDEETGAIENILYPLYVPSNTYLSSSDRVETDIGDRIILTFGGEKNFVLVEEKAVMAEEFEIIPVYGDPLIVNDIIGALGANSLTWTKDNISYYLAGNDLTTAELLAIGESVGYNNQTVSAEK